VLTTCGFSLFGSCWFTEIKDSVVIRTVVDFRKYGESETFGVVTSHCIDYIACPDRVGSTPAQQ